MLDWFSGARDESIDELIRRKRYGKAVKLLRIELEKRKADRRLWLRLGEILVLAGQPAEGVRLLSKAADDMALHGQVAQAIAILKKIEAIEPGREDVEDKLAYLVQRRANPTFDPWKNKAGAGSTGDDALEIGLELESRVDAAEASAVRTAAADPDSEIGAEEITEDAFGAVLREEILAVVEKALVSQPAAEDGAAAATDDRPVVDTPLFRSLDRDELVALVDGLKLLAFEPGQIIVSEGEPGASLFVLTSGTVRAYVRNMAQEQVQLRRLKEGDFFGEISVLSGGARTATITAASRCELLELPKLALDRIAQTHPHVREVLQEFHDKRKDNTLETLSRSVRLPGR